MSLPGSASLFFIVSDCVGGLPVFIKKFPAAKGTGRVRGITVSSVQVRLVSEYVLRHFAALNVLQNDQ